MMRRSLRRLVIVASGLMAATGCGQSTIYNSMTSTAYRSYIYGQGYGFDLSTRDLNTIVLGNPFDLDQQQMAERLLAKFNARATLPQPTRFTTTPGPSARPEFKFVLLFNRAVVLPNAVCRAPDQIPAAELGSTMRLTATFCHYASYLTTVTGELENLTGIDDPSFDRLIGQMAPLLFPRSNRPARTMGAGIS